MKKKLLFFFLFVGGTFYSNAQEKTPLKLVRTEPNGIQVYEASGNETLISNEQLNSPSRNLNDWNLEECENALYFVGLKIERMKENEGNELQIQEYEAQKVLIQDRMKTLNSKN